MNFVNQEAPKKSIQVEDDNDNSHFSIQFLNSIENVPWTLKGAQGGLRFQFHRFLPKIIWNIEYIHFV